MTLATSNAFTSSPQHCLTGEGGEINTILHYLQKICFDLTISLNIFCEGLYVAQGLVLKFPYFWTSFYQILVLKVPY